jgi:hypothetical protein
MNRTGTSAYSAQRAILLLAFAVLSFGAGTAGAASTAGSAGPIMTVEIERIRFVSDRLPIKTPVELCLPPVLRTRQWNVGDYPFRVDLGMRTSQHFQRLVKSAFKNVTVTLGPNCGSTTDLPWITARIVSANRETPGEVDHEFQYSAIKLLTTLYADNDDEIWEYTADAVVARRPVWGDSRILKFFAVRWLSVEAGNKVYFLTLLPPTFYMDSQRHVDAAESFGEAINLALELTWADLMSADSVRTALEAGAGEPLAQQHMGLPREPNQ